jgi:hypothetical protein
MIEHPVADSQQEKERKEKLIKNDELELNKPIRIQYIKWDGYEENYCIYEKISKEEVEIKCNEILENKNENIRCLRCGQMGIATSFSWDSRYNNFEGYCKNCSYKFIYYSYNY